MVLRVHAHCIDLSSENLRNNITQDFIENVFQQHNLSHHSLRVCQKLRLIEPSDGKTSLFDALHLIGFFYRENRMLNEWAQQLSTDEKKNLEAVLTELNQVNFQISHKSLSSILRTETYDCKLRWLMLFTMTMMANVMNCVPRMKHSDILRSRSGSFLKAC